MCRETLAQRNMLTSPKKVHAENLVRTETQLMGSLPMKLVPIWMRMENLNLLMCPLVLKAVSDLNLYQSPAFQAVRCPLCQGHRYLEFQVGVLFLVIEPMVQYQFRLQDQHLMHLQLHTEASSLRTSLFVVSVGTSISTVTVLRPRMTLSQHKLALASCILIMSMALATSNS